MNTLRTQLSQWLWLAIIAILLFNVGVLIHLFLFPSPTHYSSVVFVHAGNAFGWFLGAFICARGNWRTPVALPERSSSLLVTYHHVPLWISLAFFANGIGEIVSTSYYLQHALVVPFWVQGLFLLQYPCLLFAILGLPGTSLSLSQHLRLVLDGLLFMTAVLTWCWYVLLGPILLEEPLPALTKVVELAYPCADLVLFGCLFRLLFDLHNPILRQVRLLLLLGIAMIIPSDSINVFSHMVSPSTQLWITVSASGGYGLIAIAVQLLLALKREHRELSITSDLAPVEPAYQDKTVALAPRWQMLLPYALVPTVLALLLWLWFTDRQSVLSQGVYLGGIMVMVQLLVRQVMVTQETRVANEHLRALHQEVQLKQQTLHLANKQLNTANERLADQAKQLAAAYQQQFQINELKDRLLLHVSHELRTPLTEVHGYLSLLHEHHDQLDSLLQATFLSHALHGSEELQNVISSIQQTLESETLVGPPQWEAFLLETVALEVIQRFAPRIQEEYHLKLDIPKTLTVRADRQHVHQILFHLLSNATKYCPPQTVIQIGAQPDATDASWTTLWVQDEGPGIPPDEIPSLFGKFVRLKRDMAGSVRGIGLGLYTSRRLIEGMGGRLWVESTGIKGQGSRFCLTLPLSGVQEY